MGLEGSAKGCQLTLVWPPLEWWSLNQRMPECASSCISELDCLASPQLYLPFPPNPAVASASMHPTPCRVALSLAHQVAPHA